MDGNVDENSAYVILSKMIKMHARYVEEPYIQVMFRILVGYRIGGKFVRSLIGG